MGGGRGSGGGPGGGCVLSADLLPCPFCGSITIGEPLRRRPLQAACIDCGAEGPEAHTVDEARASWNARPADTNARFVSEAKIVLGDIADAIGGAGKLGETHGDTIRRLVAEVARLRAPTPAASELPDGWSLDERGVASEPGGSVFIDKGECVQIYGWASRAPIAVVEAVIAAHRDRFGGGA